MAKPIITACPGASKRISHQRKGELNNEQSGNSLWG